MFLLHGFVTVEIDIHNSSFKCFCIIGKKTSYALNKIFSNYFFCFELNTWVILTMKFPTA